MSERLVRQCAMCGVAIADDSAPVLCIPMTDMEIRLCAQHHADVMRVGLGALAGLADVGVTPDAMKRGALAIQGISRIVDAFRGPRV